MNFKDFFFRATGNQPYPFQERFAEAAEIPHLLRAPTGAGKTATAVLSWLYRWNTRSAETPRRLVYCLPMRVLVEQSERETKGWIAKLKLDAEVEVHVLMGGADTNEWYLQPERPAILIGTQDMLLSRALNRGYAASRFHWPIDFGLLNNDSLWVFDEPQLMGNGVSTSAQLAGFRKQLDTFGSCPSVWMSATLEPGWLDTVDFRGKFPGKPLELGTDKYGDDYAQTSPLYKRMTATKTLAKLGAASSKDMKEVALEVLGTGGIEGLHRPGTQTLIVLNTVDRAKAMYDAITKSKKAPSKTLLVHSRFRPAEREALNSQLQEKDDATMDRVIVATQVVEAGVDISSRTLITELAPWSSIVQRIGRCNRTGDDGPGRVFWIDLDEKLAPPYEWVDLEFARKQLVKLEAKNVSPKELDEFKTRENITLPFQHKHVLRRRDLLDLFDTAPDLSGNDIDIARFVRSDDPDTDVQVFWREVPGNGPHEDEPAPHRRELCNVPVGQAKAFLDNLGKKKMTGYVWDHLDGEWQRIDPKQIRPGLAIMLPSSTGGYSELGWDSESKNAITTFPTANKVKEESNDSDQNSAIRVALTIANHTKNVIRHLDEILRCQGELAPDEHDHLRIAALWHDVGKAHQAFQVGMRRANPSLSVGQLWAKSGVNTRLIYGRPHFRHELASALAVMQQQSNWPFLVAYLVATHHGKVRLSIRSLPGEDPPENPQTLFALGVRDADELPETDLGSVTCAKTKLDLSPMRLGDSQSWTANSLSLLANFGPFKLAYLETLLRSADLAQAKRRRNMREVSLAGCTSEPLMSYLKALGVFRLVAEQKDPSARLMWRGSFAVVHSTLDRAELLKFFSDEYRPTPITSPWNGGSGFYRTWDAKAQRFRSREAVDRVAFIRNSTSQRLIPYKSVITEIQDTLIRYATTIDVASMPEKERKATLLLDEATGISDADQSGILPYLRATLPDETVRWLDTVFLLQADEMRAAPLFISGGNDGNFDFSVTFIGSIETLFKDPGRSTGWLLSSVFGEGDEALDSGAIGHFNPAGLGGPNGGQGLFGTGSVNPWDVVFMMEGAILLAGAVTRRLGVQAGDRAAFPFCVMPVAAGFGSAGNNDETSDNCRTELWLPLWSALATLPDLQYLFAEGRAQVGRRQARNAVEFALATCLLGVNRGISSFVRFSFLRRSGKMFLAAPLGHVVVTPRPSARLLDDPPLTDWLERLRSACRDKDKTPARYQSALRQIDSAMFAFANRSEQGNDRRYLVDVLVALGRAERSLANGLAFCKDKYLKPLNGLSNQWLELADDASAEFRLAASLAAISKTSKGDLGPLRMFVEPVEVTGYVNWMPGSTSAVWSARPLSGNLAAVFRRRQMEAYGTGLAGAPLRSLRAAGLDDVISFLNHDVDDERLSDLIWGLIGVEYPTEFAAPQRREADIPFEFGVPRLLVQKRSLIYIEGFWRLSNSDNEANLKPDPDVFHELASGRGDATDRCVTRAARRLKSGGLMVNGYRNRRQAGKPLAVFSLIDPERLLAAMLFPLSDNDIERIASSVLYPPESEG